MLVSFGYGSRVRTVMTLVGSNPSRTLHQIAETAQQQTGRDHQHDRQRTLRDDERGASARLPPGVRRAADRGLERRHVPGRRAADAGAHPKMTPDVIVVRAANSSTLQLSRDVVQPGQPVRNDANERGLRHQQTRRGRRRRRCSRGTGSRSAVAASDDWRLRRSLAAPRTPGVVCSRERAGDWRRSRSRSTGPGRLPQSIRISDGRTSPTTVSCSGTRRTVHPLRSG